MKDLPEIAPELRGLLEEIVNDPRSAIRLAPRRALRSWFESGEVARARDVSTTRAERHLVEAHREALAEMLLEASIIAYWKEPVSLSIRPIGPDSAAMDPSQSESSWRGRASTRVRNVGEEAVGVELLRSCLEGIDPKQGQALASASLNLVPRDQARLCLTFHAATASPRWALSLAEQTAARTASRSIRGLALTKAAAQYVSLGRLSQAWQRYEEVSSERPNAWFSLFNLACITGRRDAALECSSEMGRSVASDSPIVFEACELLRGWVRSRPSAEIRLARLTAKELSDVLSSTAAKVVLAYA